jgi:4,5-dihydroxyphthalate decarboxylase
MAATEPLLRTVTRSQGNNAALKDGRLKPAGYRLAFVDVPVLVQGFRRMVRQLEFDVCEMALTTYLTAREHGVAFTALPVFLVRGFHHGAIHYNVNSGITSPRDLEDRRVGVNRGYTVTTGVWARSVLDRDYGVNLDRVTWVPTGDEHVVAYRPPRNVVPAEPGSDLVELLATGELDAAVGLDPAAVADHPDIAPLIRDADGVAMRALVERGHYPINHLIVVKDDVLRAHPDVATALYDVFTSAKDAYVEALQRGAGSDSHDATDRMYSRVMAATGADPLPYGIEPNRDVLEDLIEQALRQRILTKPIAVEDVFAQSVLEQAG